MEPGAVVGTMPTASQWFLNPFFAASFGAAMAFGLILVGVGYLLYKAKGIVSSSEAQSQKCTSCGLGQDILKEYNCKAHEATQVRMRAAEEWLRDMREDYNELRRRVDAIERAGRYGHNGRS